jgi:hypothetical protein
MNSKNLRDIDKLISENLRMNSSASQGLFSLEGLESQEIKKKQKMIKQYREEIDELRKIAVNQYGVNLNQEAEDFNEEKIKNKPNLNLDFEMFRSKVSKPNPQTQFTSVQKQARTIVLKHKNRNKSPESYDPYVPKEFVFQMGTAKEELKDLPLTNFKYVKPSYEYLNLLNQKKPPTREKMSSYMARTTNGTLSERNLFFTSNNQTNPYKTST